MAKDWRLLRKKTRTHFRQANAYSARVVCSILARLKKFLESIKKKKDENYDNFLNFVTFHINFGYFK